MLLIMTKAKIITLTFNPCIDKSTSVQSLMPEKKLYCAIPKLEPGGGGINVARAIKKLGGEATAIFPSGGCTGKVFTALLEKENIDIVAISTAEETRESISVVEESTNNQYRFGMPSNGLSESEWQQCLKAVEGIKDAEYMVASGSLPLNVPLNIYAQLAKIAKKNKAKLIVDVSGEALKEALEEGVYLLKPNLGELSALVGKKELQPNEVAAVALDIIAKGHCKVMVVSMGAAGAMLVTKDIVKTITPPQVVRKSTIGAGDSMVAGIVLSLSKGKSLIEAVQYGVACGTAATMNAGTELCRKADVDKLFKLVTVD